MVQWRTSCFFSGASACALRNISTSGRRNASVLPLPVHASTATSLLVHSKGMTAAWTGVARAKPRSRSTVREVSHSGGTSWLHSGPASLPLGALILARPMLISSVGHVLPLSALDGARLRASGFGGVRCRRPGHGPRRVSRCCVRPVFTTPVRTTWLRL